MTAVPHIRRAVNGDAVRQFALDAIGSPLRAPVAAAAAVAAVAHLPVIAPHLHEAPYMGVLFVVLTVACAALCASALVRDSAAVYALAALTSGLALVGYAATRLVAFPMLADDVGNWFEPLGIVSVAAELGMLGSAAVALRLGRPAGQPESPGRPSRS